MPLTNLKHTYQGKMYEMNRLFQILNIVFTFVYTVYLSIVYMENWN